MADYTDSAPQEGRIGQREIRSREVENRNLSTNAIQVNNLSGAGSPANIGNTIVTRDANGNFAAGQITAQQFVGQLVGGATGSESPLSFTSPLQRVGNTVAISFTPVNKTGDTMTGPLILSQDPALGLEATTKRYADLKLALSGGTMTGAIGWPYFLKTAAYTIGDLDNFVACDATAAAFTVTLPTSVGLVGREYTIKKIDSTANAVTVQGAGTEKIDAANTYSLAAQYSTITIVSNNVSWYIKSKI